MENIIIAIIGGFVAFMSAVVGYVFAAKQSGKKRAADAIEADKKRAADKLEFEATIKAQIQSAAKDTAAEVEELVWQRTRLVIKDMQDEIDTLKVTVIELQESLDKKDAEIERLKKGKII